TLTPAERDVMGFLNTLDAWPTTQAARVDFTGPLDARSLHEESVQLLRWDGRSAMPVEDVEVRLTEGDTRIEILPPKLGWDRGATYFAYVRGGERGVRGRRDEPVEPDPAFYFLRLAVPLDDPAYQRAFPGDTREER